MTVTEILVAAAIAVTLISAIFGMSDPLQGMFDSQLELGEMHQRLRAGVHAIERDVLAAASPVMPYRIGSRRSDPAAGVFYRSDTVTAMSGDSPALTHTYYLKRDDAAGTAQLMHYDGVDTDAPVVDHVVGLAFEYVDEDGLAIDPAALQDGPWLPGDATTGAFDADLLRIRHVRVTLRVQASRETLRGPAGTLFTYGGSAASIGRYLPDREINIEIAPRNLDRD
jgi:hypothetical protein